MILQHWIVNVRLVQRPSSFWHFTEFNIIVVIDILGLFTTCQWGWGWIMRWDEFIEVIKGWSAAITARCQLSFKTSLCFPATEKTGHLTTVPTAVHCSNEGLRVLLAFIVLYCCYTLNTWPVQTLIQNWNSAISDEGLVLFASTLGDMETVDVTAVCFFSPLS